MTSDATHPLPSPFQSNIEVELLECILQGDGPSLWTVTEGSDRIMPYPWNPADPEAEDYFAAMEQEVLAAGWSDEELATEGRRLAATFEQAWATVTPSAAVRDAMARHVSTDMFQRFMDQVPSQLLESIVQRAQQVLAEQATLADQLVACVQSVLPGWGDDDLQVLARPFAYAMRGAETEMLEAALRSVRCAAWTELSGIEQARLSLAIARYALAQMPAHPHDHA